jgi:deoxyxylulose-5-phosphate synthase
MDLIIEIYKGYNYSDYNIVWDVGYQSYIN